jgi:hypothetical protein
LLALTQLLFFLEQSFGATMRLIQIGTQSISELLGKAPTEDHGSVDPKPRVFGVIK